MIHYIRISEETQGIRRSVQKKVTYAGKHKKHRCEGREKTWQAGQRGTHFAFRAISAAAKTALCLSGAAPLKPFERARCAAARFCETLGSMAVTAGHAPVSFPHCAHPCPASCPRSACGAAARASHRANAGRRHTPSFSPSAAWRIPPASS